MFDLIIGNPPYQESDGRTDLAHSAGPLYNQFIRKAVADSRQYVSMIVPARWYTTGRGLKDFREFMLSSKNISILCDFQRDTDCFENVNIAGGVMWFVWDKAYLGDTTIINVNGDKRDAKQRPLIEPEFADAGGAGLFLRHNERVGIYKKVATKMKELNLKPITDIISPMNPFGIRAQFTLFEKEQQEGLVPLYILINLRRQKVWVDPAHIKWDDTNRHYANRWKVMISKAGDGRDYPPCRVSGRAFVAEPDAVCAENYVVLADFATREEAERLVVYTRTKFFRFMLLACKNSQHMPRLVYRYVPIIWGDVFAYDWTDELLYRQFGLTSEEAGIIERTIKPMKP